MDERWGSYEHLQTALSHVDILQFPTPRFKQWTTYMPETLNSIENMWLWSNLFRILFTLLFHGPNGSCQGFLKHTTNWPTLFIHHSLFWRWLFILFLLIFLVCGFLNKLMQYLLVSLRILGLISTSSGRSYRGPFWTKRLLLCNQACCKLHFKSRMSVERDRITTWNMVSYEPCFSSQLYFGT